MIPEVTAAGNVVPEGRCLSDNDLYYLRSIARQLESVIQDCRKRDFGISLGVEILADNIDWLDCFIEKHGRSA